jgi:hypothetical protein
MRLSVVCGIFLLWGVLTLVFWWVVRPETLLLGPQGLTPSPEQLRRAMEQHRGGGRSYTCRYQFDAPGYVGANPDVLQAGLKPHVHLLTHGLEERRAHTFVRTESSDLDSPLYLVAHDCEQVPASVQIGLSSRSELGCSEQFAWQELDSPTLVPLDIRESEPPRLNILLAGWTFQYVIFC